MRVAWLAGALVVLAALGGWWGSRRAPPAPVPGAGDPEKESLRREVADLKARLAVLQASPPDLSPGRPDAGAVVAPAEAPRVPAAELLARARAALQAKDAGAFVDAFDALLGSGEDAYPGIVEIVQTLGDGEVLFGTPQGREAVKRYLRSVSYHAPRLGGLMDLILARGGEPDKATLFALGLVRAGGACGLPKERQVEVMLDVLRHPFPSPISEEEVHFARLMAAKVLGNLKATETIPVLESLYREAPEKDREIFMDAFSNLGEAGGGTLQRLLERSKDRHERAELISALGDVGGRDGKGSPLLWEIASRKDNPTERAEALRLLASRPGNLDRILQEWEGPEFSPGERHTMLASFMNAAQVDPAVRSRLWEVYERDPTGREDLFKEFIQRDDPKAKQILTEALRTGRMSDAMAVHLERLDPATFRENAMALQVLAADRNHSIKARCGAAGALWGVDPRAATDALLGGFEGLREEDRLFLVREFGEDADEETRARLRGLAERDPSPKVQEAAKRLAKP